MTVTRKTGNVPTSGARKAKASFCTRYDVPFDVVNIYLRRHREGAAWELEERQESIGVYLTCSKGTHEVVHALNQGWKLCSEHLFRQAAVVEVINPLGDEVDPLLAPKTDLLRKKCKEEGLAYKELPLGPALDAWNDLQGFAVPPEPALDPAIVDKFPVVVDLDKENAKYEARKEAQ